MGFSISNGVRQGCVLAPLLFNVYLTAMLIIVDRKLLDRGIGIRYRTDGGLFNLARLKSRQKVRSRFVTELQYADDIALLANTADAAQDSTDTFENVYNALGLEISAAKTKVLRVNCGDEQVAAMRSKSGDIEDVNEFNYLGSIVTQDGAAHAEVSHRLRKASAAVFKLSKRVFNNPDLRRGTKLAVYRAVVLPTLLYGSETWTIYKSQIKSLEKFHQRHLRKLLGIKWTDFISNRRVLELAKCESVECMITRSMLRWMGHVKRMEDSRLPKQLLFGELQEGVRRSGGQRKRYKDQCHAALKMAKIDKAWESSCENRVLWRSLINNNAGMFAKRGTRHTATPATFFICDTCGRTTTSRIGLISHTRTHLSRN